MPGKFSAKRIGLGSAERFYEESWNRAENDQVIRRWEGDIPSVQARKAALRAPGGADAYQQIPQDNGTLVLLASYSNASALSSWELLGNFELGDMKQHPRFNLFSHSELVEIIKLELRTTVTNGVLESDTDIAAMFPDTVSAFNEKRDAAKLYLELVRRGHTFFPRDYYVLRQTLYASTKYQIKLAFNNLNGLYKSAEMASEFSARGHPIPIGIAFAISDIRVPNFSSSIPPGTPLNDDRRNYLTRWLKMRPTVETERGGPWGYRYLISQDFVLDNWHRRVYIPVLTTDRHPNDIARTPGWIPTTAPP